MTHAFDELGAHRVEFKTDALNARSQAALEAIGATREGTLRRHLVMDNGRDRLAARVAEAVSRRA